LDANKVGDFFRLLKEKTKEAQEGKGRKEGGRLEKTRGIGEGKDGDKEWNRRGW
jgi:hypothetical protein